jgi:RecB family exonuclease
MTLPALVAELRAVVVDPEAGRTPSGAARRRRAAAHLARLAAAGVGGADPQDWYGLAELSSAEPLRGDGEGVRVSPSRVEAFDRCPLRWLLEQAGGRRPVPTGVRLGTLVHELAEAVPDGDILLLRELLERRFGRLGLRDGWAGDVERAKAERMLERLSAYVRESRAAGRELVATEREVTVQLGRAEIRGTVDRLERDAEGRLVVVDLKTGASQPRAAELDRNAQLGVYQLAIEAGGEPSGGAELVQLGARTKRVTVQHQRPLGEDEDPGWARELVETVAEGMAAGQFPATVNPRCRMCELRRCCPAQLEGRQVGS